MINALNSVKELVAKFAQLTLLGTGLPLKMPDSSAWPTDCEAEEEFQVVITFIYKCWREMWESEITFLSKFGAQDNGLASFRLLINDLRTRYQHSDNPDATQRANNWLSSKSFEDGPVAIDWTRCATVLLDEFESALKILCAKALAVTRNDSSRASWAAVNQLSAETIVSVVAADLGLSFGAGTFQHHVREAQKKIDRINSKSADLRGMAEQVTEAYLVADHRRLPVPYRDILTDLNLIGRPRAGGCLRLAHSVAELTTLRGDPFISTVRSIWLNLQKI